MLCMAHRLTHNTCGRKPAQTHTHTHNSNSTNCLQGGAEKGNVFMNAQFVYSHQMDGITLVRYKRALRPQDEEWDNPIRPEQTGFFVWAQGGTNASANCNDAGPAIKSHGQRHDQDFGMVALQFGSSVFNCPTIVPDRLSSHSSLAKSPAVTEAGWLGAELNGVIHLKWQVQPNTRKLLLTVTSLVQAQWISIAFGSAMVGSDAIVGWVDAVSSLVRVEEYEMTSLDASGVTPVQSDAPKSRLDRSYATAAGVTDGAISFTVSVDDPELLTTSVPIIWAVGDTWQLDPTNDNYHTRRSGLAATIDFRDGSVTEASVDAKLVAHGALMCVAWTILLPLGIFFARFRSDATGFLWITAHKRATVLAGGFMLVAFVIIIAWVIDTGRGARFCSTVHGKVSVSALVLLLIQIVWAVYRPGKVSAESTAREKGIRKGWEIGHRVGAMLSVILALVACFTGLERMEEWGVDNMQRYQISLGIWIAAVVLVWLVREIIKARPLQSKQGSSNVTTQNPVYDAPQTSHKVHGRYQQTDLDHSSAKHPSSTTSASRLSIMEGFGADHDGVHYFEENDSRRNSIDVDDVDGDMGVHAELAGGYLQVQRPDDDSSSDDGEVDLDAETQPGGFTPSPTAHAYDEVADAKSPSQVESASAHGPSAPQSNGGKQAEPKEMCSPRFYWVRTVACTGTNTYTRRRGRGTERARTREQESERLSV